jgi:hypothetical protein
MGFSPFSPGVAVRERRRGWGKALSGHLRLERHPTPDGIFLIAAGVLDSDTLDALVDACRDHCGRRIDLDVGGVTLFDDASLAFLADLATLADLRLAGEPPCVAHAVGLTTPRRAPQGGGDLAALQSSGAAEGEVRTQGAR